MKPKYGRMQIISVVIMLLIIPLSSIWGQYGDAVEIVTQLGELNDNFCQGTLVTDGSDEFDLVMPHDFSRGFLAEIHSYDQLYPISLTSVLHLTIPVLRC